MRRTTTNTSLKITISGYFDESELTPDVLAYLCEENLRHWVHDVLEKEDVDVTVYARRLP